MCAGDKHFLKLSLPSICKVARGPVTHNRNRQPEVMDAPCSSAQMFSSARGTKRRGRRSWAEIRDAISKSMPPGPTTRLALSEWPLTLAKCLLDSGNELDEEICLRLLTLLQSKLVFYTDYSGLDCPRECMEYALSGLVKQLGWHLPHDCAKFTRTCDIGSLQTKVLTEISKKVLGGSSCHFDDILGRLPQVARDWIEAALPTPGMSKEVREQANSDIKAWLQLNKSWLFPPGATSYCHVCDKMCPVHPSYITDAQEPQHKRQKLLASSCSSRPDELEDGKEEISEETRPLYINVGGVPCTAWSAEGSQDGWAHASEVPHAVWSCERQQFAARSDEDLFFSECTPRYPVQQKLPEGMKYHRTLTITIGPECMGWPVRRQRLLMCGLNLKTLRWVGPDNYVHDFKQRYYRGMRLSGDTFFEAPEDEVHAEYMHLAHGRKFQVSRAEVSSLSTQAMLDMALPPGARLRLQHYHEKRANLEPDQVLICDVDHNPDTKGSSPGSEWPVQLTHGTFINVTHDPEKDRVAIGMEHLSAMGFNIYPPQDCSLHRSRLVDVLKALPTRQQKLLAGNGMHLVTQAAWMMYVLANVVRVRPDTVPRLLKLASWDPDQAVEVED